tara:strand:+ start:126 stop:425 length:300 start_codon:yes stop_codon:yes gene_type:complete
MLGMDLDKKALKDIIKGMGKIGKGKPKAMSVSVEKVDKMPHEMKEIKEVKKEKMGMDEDAWPMVKEKMAQIKDMVKELEEIIGKGYYKEDEEKEEIEEY